MASDMFRFRHESFRAFFHAKWWGRQPEDSILLQFSNPDWYNLTGFHSYLSLRFFCDMHMKEGDTILMPKIADAVLAHGDLSGLYRSLAVANLSGLLSAVCDISLETANPSDIGHNSSLLSTPLMTAARLGKLACLKVLIKHGADPNQVVARTRETALAFAVMFNHEDCVQYLMANFTE
jgi:ankyrin repeat protein